MLPQHSYTEKTLYDLFGLWFLIYVVKDNAELLGSDGKYRDGLVQV
jgi:hypothetical protein